MKEEYDLIGRLRAGTGGGKHWMDLHEEAADEIARLREELRHSEMAASAEAREVDRLRAENAALRVDAERLVWIEEKLFEHKWNGVIDSGSRVNWSIAGDFRHTTQHMVGNTFRDAIDAARGGNAMTKLPPPIFQVRATVGTGLIDVCRAADVVAYGIACAAAERAACIAICDIEASRNLEADDLAAYYGTSAYAISNAIKARGTI